MKMNESIIFDVNELLEVADCCFADRGHVGCPKCPYCCDDDCKEIWEDKIYELLKLLVKKRVTKITFELNDLDDKNLPTVLVIDSKLDESALTNTSLK